MRIRTTKRVEVDDVAAGAAENPRDFAELVIALGRAYAEAGDVWRAAICTALRHDGAEAHAALAAWEGAARPPAQTQG